ncbi:hypothetical protein PIB30_033416 [Stylosanthes scabra]|uniref:FBD domain-containing protein n=1 Tax=Stylosanthes scabra TaxID=79078 RepID=A0ABU6RCM5_9FABA|nr:hypothetical protein [Stylosanthes scabra]
MDHTGVGKLQEDCLVVNSHLKFLYLVGNSGLDDESLTMLALVCPNLEMKVSLLPPDFNSSDIVRQRDFFLRRGCLVVRSEDFYYEHWGESDDFLDSHRTTSPQHHFEIMESDSSSILDPDKFNTFSCKTSKSIFNSFTPVLAKPNCFIFWHFLRTSTIHSPNMQPQEFKSRSSTMGQMEAIFTKL